MLKITEEVNDILELGYSISTERYYFKLFDLILDGCMKFTNADGGNLYIEDRGRLKQLTFVNRSLGLYRGRGGEPIDNVEIDINSHNLMAYTASHKVNLNIADIYKEKKFEVLSIKEFDVVHNYRTKSLLTVPIFEQGKSVLGVMQLTNCMDDDGNVIPFPEPYVKMVNSLTAQMAMALTNMLLIQDLEELLRSFVASLTTAIDARTPYNANHTVHVAQYCLEVVDYINALHTRGEYDNYIDRNDSEQLYMAAMLHDIGKMITPREVLNKSTRLGDKFDKLINKLEKIKLLMKIDMLEGRMDNADWAMADLRLSNFMAELPGLNIRERITESELRRIRSIAAYIYVDKNGNEIPYLDEEELKSLSIERGTLTQEERSIVEQHVVFTDKMLSKIKFDEIKFSENYDKVREIAADHHEYLDGSGYPNHKKGEEIGLLTRILTIVDIYDSLTSTDRPYKGTVPMHKALEILMSMAKEGKLDMDLVRIISDYIRKKNKI
ncbi:MAG: HD domain-containing protein [Lachnospiraceae bacterium]|nr:HD domain-containing protein [Lachnospiraceae bacterium]